MVRTLAGQVVEDPSGRLAGRGAYFCAAGDCRERALKKGVLSRALSVSIPAGDRAQLMTGGDERG
jgi:predicted RNA-binding protein YlxR (DUF448 family)